jgi:hypothetical protein
MGKMVERKRQFYYVENWGGSWYVIRANNKQEARSHGVQEFGRGSVKTVDIASEPEIKSYIAQKGLTSIEEIDEA